MGDYIEREMIFKTWKNIPLPASVTSLSAAIHNTSAADVAPVVHGRWIAEESKSVSKRNRIIKYKIYSCSICGAGNGRHESKYCPNCGARMDGEQG